MHPIEVKCHSFIIAIAEPLILITSVQKGIMVFFWFATMRPCLFGKKIPFLIAKFAWTKTLFRSEKKLLFGRPTWPPWRQQLFISRMRVRLRSELFRIALRDFLENIVTSFAYRVFSKRWPLVFQSNERRLCWCSKPIQWYLTLFLCKGFLLFQQICIDVDHVSENAL